MYPPRIQIIAWSASKKSPQTHTVGMSLNSQPYLNLIASLNSLLLRVKFISLKGITLSQREAPFSLMIIIIIISIIIIIIIIIIVIVIVIIKANSGL